MGTVNKLSVYRDEAEFEKSDFLRMKSYHWESEPPYRPKTYFKIGVVGDDLAAVLKCYESNPKADFTERNAPVYRDSCLEFFVLPIAERKEYINIEVNSKGIFLCEFGDGRENRVQVSSLTETFPRVRAFFGKDLQGDFWAVDIRLTKKFLSELYNIQEEKFDFSVVKANFYKCGDDCEVPHYIAFAPVTTLPPGFHNPECFAVFEKLGDI